MKFIGTPFTGKPKANEQKHLSKEEFLASLGNLKTILIKETGEKAKEQAEKTITDEFLINFLADLHILKIKIQENKGRQNEYEKEMKKWFFARKEFLTMQFITIPAFFFFPLLFGYEIFIKNPELTTENDLSAYKLLVKTFMFGYVFLTTLMELHPAQFRKEKRWLMQAQENEGQLNYSIKSKTEELLVLFTKSGLNPGNIEKIAETAYKIRENKAI